MGPDTHAAAAVAPPPPPLQAAPQQHATKRRRGWGLLRYIGVALRRAFLLEGTIARGLPTLRGKVHLLLLYLAPVWVLTLYHYCHTRTAFIATSICVLSSLFNFTASALLHNGDWSDHVLEVMTKLDYAGIFIMIGGSCSTVPMMLMSRRICTAFLIIQWTAAFLGVWTTLFRKYTAKANEVRATVYIAMGLSNCIFLRQMLQLLNPFEFVCIIAMGVFYILGALCYARRSPDVWPKVFGYHEIFHACCLIAAICTYLLNQSVLARAAQF